MGVSPLADLIEEVQAAYLRRNRTPLTQADLVRRCDGKLTSTEISNYLTKVPDAMPKYVEKLRLLALALDVTEGEVTEAYLRSTGHVTLEMERRGIGRWREPAGATVTRLSPRKVSEPVSSVPRAARKGRRHEEDPGGDA